MWWSCDVMWDHVVVMWDHVMVMWDHVVVMWDHVVVMWDHVGSCDGHVRSCGGHVGSCDGHVRSCGGHVRSCDMRVMWPSMWDSMWWSCDSHMIFCLMSDCLAIIIWCIILHLCTNPLVILFGRGSEFETRVGPNQASFDWGTLQYNSMCYIHRPSWVWSGMNVTWQSCDICLCILSSQGPPGATGPEGQPGIPGPQVRCRMGVVLCCYGNTRSHSV